MVRYIPLLMQRVGKKASRQIVVSTHSADLLADRGIAADEVVMLFPTADGTEARLSSSHQEIKALVESGLSIGEAVLPRTAPKDAQQLALFQL